MKKIIILCISSMIFGASSSFKVDGMMCAMNCPKKVNNSLNGIDGIKSCKVDFGTSHFPLKIKIQATLKQQHDNNQPQASTIYKYPFRDCIWIYLISRVFKFY